MFAYMILRLIYWQCIPKLWIRTFPSYS